MYKINKLFSLLCQEPVTNEEVLDTALGFFAMLGLMILAGAIIS